VPAAMPVYDGPSKPYIGLRYMNPFNLWFPMPLVRSMSDENLSLRLDGGGIFSIITDPPDRNMVYFLVYYDIPYKMAMVDQFNWKNTSLGLPLTVTLFDKIMEPGNSTYRYTSASLSGTLSWTRNQWNNQIILGGGYVRTAAYENEESAYEWKETGSGFFMQTGFVLSYRRLSLQFSGASLTDNFEPRLDMVFRAYTKTRFPLSFTLFGAYDKRGMDLHGVSNTFGSTAVEGLALKEYPNLFGLDLLWLGGGEISLGIFSFEIQNHISHLYFNRFFGNLLIRNQIYDSGGHPEAEGLETYGHLRLAQSLGLKLGIKTSFFPIYKIPVSVEPYVLGTWKFSNTITGNGFPFYVDIGINASF
jgi:hypothetical protein